MCVLSVSLVFQTLSHMDPVGGSSGWVLLQEVLSIAGCMGKHQDICCEMMFYGAKYSTKIRNSNNNVLARPLRGLREVGRGG